MSRPTLEVADIVRRTGNSFWEQQQAHLAWPHRKVLDAIVRCRTAALGGHLDKCVRCGHQAISFNSCRNRHCPKCQGNARYPSDQHTYSAAVICDVLEAWAKRQWD